MRVSTYKEIIKLLKTKGVKAVVAVNGNPGFSVYCEKADLLREIEMRRERGQTGPTDYDGNPVDLYYDEDNKLLSIDGGL